VTPHRDARKSLRNWKDGVPRRRPIAASWNMQRNARTAAGGRSRCESFNGKLRDELLNLWQFDSLLEARVHIEDWRIDYNTNRPHTAHGDLTPTEFATAWNLRHQTQHA
jgi:hypothetical protein